MERKEAQSIGDVLRMAFQENCMQERLDERKAINVWPEIVGRQLAEQCLRPTVSGGIMTIGVKNAALRHELTMSRTRLISAVNRFLGKEVISGMRFTSA